MELNYKIIAHVVSAFDDSEVCKHDGTVSFDLRSYQNLGHTVRRVAATVSLTNGRGEEYTKRACGNCSGMKDLDALAQEAATDLVTRVMGHTSCDLGRIEYVGKID